MTNTCKNRPRHFDSNDEIDSGIEFVIAQRVYHRLRNLDSNAEIDNDGDFVWEQTRMRL